MPQSRISTAITRKLLIGAAAFALGTVTMTFAATAALPSLTPAAAPTSEGAKVLEQDQKGLDLLAQADESLLIVADKELKLQRLVDRLAELTLQIKSNNLAIAGLNKLQPTNTLAALDKASAAAKGAGDTPWVPGEQANIPSLTLAQKMAADIQAQIQKLTADRADMEKKRDIAAAQAQTLSRQAETMTGRQGLAVYTQAASVRKTMADLMAQMDDADAKLMLLQQDLSLAQAQAKQVEEAINRIAELSKQTNAGWDSIQKQMQAYTALSQTIAQGSGTQPAANIPPVTVAAAVDQMDALAKEIATERQKADGLLSSAASQFGQTEASAKRLSQEYSTNLQNRRESAQAAAWTAGADTFNPAGPRFQKAQTELRQAQMWAAAYYSAAARAATLKDLRTALDEAKLTLEKVTGDLVSAPEGDKNAAVEKARPLFDSAETDLGAAANGNSPVKDAARITQVIEEYAYGLLLRATQNTELANTQFEKARTSAGDLASSNVNLPPLPAELGVKTSSGAGPTTAPAEGAPAPTTAPAEGGTAPTSAPAEGTISAPATAPATQPAQ
jgi:hypothetical protein